MASKKNTVEVIDLPVKLDTSTARLSHRDPFPKVKEAREALKERALELFETYLAIINEARNEKDFETAFKATQWLIEHMPKDDGQGVVDQSSTKPKESSGGSSSSAPVIQIGFKLGGIDRPKIENE